MQTEPFDLQELFQYVFREARAAWRYRWRALMVAWCVMVAGALVVFSLPNKYESSAQVYADTDALTNPLLRGVAMQPDVKARLQVVTHTLLSRPNLETVADKTGLALRASTPTEKDELLLKLGNTVRIKDAGTTNLYNITYSDYDREMSQKVVQAFVQILMNDTVGANTAATATAQKFLEQQVQDYGKRLSEAEIKLADFQKANLGYIPSQGGSTYFTRLQAAETQLQNLQAQYDTAVAGRATTQQQMRAMAAGSASAGIDPRTQEIDSQIATYQQKLSTLLLSYTDEYPDVASTRRMIAQLKAQRAALKKNAAGDSMMGVVSDNPVYQEMQKSMYTTQVTIQTLATQIALQKQQIAELKGAADKITDVQATLQQLTRNYDVTKKQYDQLLERLNTAQLSQDATQSGNNLKFRVISPPLMPLLPSGPHRGLLLVLVFGFAVAMGLGFAYLLHKVTPVFVTPGDLQDFGDYPVLGSLGLIVTPSGRRERRREAFGFLAGAGMLPMLLLLAFAFDGSLARLVQHFFVMGVA
jgi:polysaccharide chain length determinant protein (PEP-CTERM system associated)